MHRWHAEAFSARNFEWWVRRGVRKEVIIPGGYRHSRSGGRIAWSLKSRTKKKYISTKNTRLSTLHTVILFEVCGFEYKVCISLVTGLSWGILMRSFGIHAPNKENNNLKITH